MLVDLGSDAHKSSEHLALNPAGRIPVLTHAEGVLFESAAICLYLSEKHSNTQLLPASGTYPRALAYQWLMYLTNTLQAELMLCLYPYRHTTDESSADSIAAMQEQRLSEIFALLDNQLGDKQFLLGDSLSVCDYYLFMLLLWGEELIRPPISNSNLKRFLGTITNLKCVQRVCEKEEILLEPYK